MNREQFQSTLTNYLMQLSAAIVAIIMGLYDLTVIIYRLLSALAALASLIAYPALCLLWVSLRGYVWIFKRCAVSIQSYWKRSKQRTAHQPQQKEAPAATDDDYIFVQWAAHETIEVPA